MSIITTGMDKPYLIKVEEYERSWGSKIVQIKGFDTIDEADKFIEEYNETNAKDIAPNWSWYTMAARHNYIPIIPFEKNKI
jgi:hypothetical protein